MHILGPLVLLDLSDHCYPMMACFYHLFSIHRARGFTEWFWYPSEWCESSVPSINDRFCIFVISLCTGTCYPPTHILCGPKNNSVTAPYEREEKTHWGAYFPLPGQREITEYTSGRASLSAVINRSGQISAGQLKQYYVITFAWLFLISSNFFMYV